MTTRPGMKAVRVGTDIPLGTKTYIVGDEVTIRDRTYRFTDAGWRRLSSQDGSPQPLLPSERKLFRLAGIRAQTKPVQLRTITVQEAETRDVEATKRGINLG